MTLLTFCVPAEIILVMVADFAKSTHNLSTGISADTDYPNLSIRLLILVQSPP